MIKMAISNKIFHSQIIKSAYIDMLCLPLAISFQALTKEGQSAKTSRHSYWKCPFWQCDNNFTWWAWRIWKKRVFIVPFEMLMSIWAVYKSLLILAYAIYVLCLSLCFFFFFFVFLGFSTVTLFISCFPLPIEFRIVWIDRLDLTST